MTNDDLLHDSSKTIDAEELLLSFIVEMPKEYTDSEKAVKKGLSSLRKMRRTLTDLSQIRKEEKPRAVKPGEKAKEEAMQLLRSGAISLENKKERQTFKRKQKDLEEDESSTRAPQKSNAKDKKSLYGNFLRGPKLYPQYSSGREPEKLRSHSYSDDNNEDDGNTKPFTPSDPGCTTTAALQLEAAASKRKQQLIALSEQEEQEAGSTSYGELSNSTYDSFGGSQTTGENTQSETTLHVGYHNVSASFIRDLFKQFGTIVRIKISEQQSHAYVTMESREMAEKALELDHQMVNNRLLRVSYARKQFPPRHGFVKKIGPFSPKSGYNRPGRYGPSSHNFPTFHDPQSQSAQHDPSRGLVNYEDLMGDE